jgi:hypothetical protein
MSWRQTPSAGPPTTTSSRRPSGDSTRIAAPRLLNRYSCFDDTCTISPRSVISADTDIR